MSEQFLRWLTNSPAPAPDVPNNVTPIRRNPTEGIHPYAAAIAQAWCDRLQRLKTKPWQQGDAWDTNCYASARKLTELANSPWSGYTHEQARNDYYNHAPHDSVWDKREKCWNTGSADAGTLPEPAPNDTYDIPPVTVLPEQATLDQFWAARDILTHLHTYARARRVAPWAVLGYALARIVTATPPFIALPPIVGGHASLNLFIGIVGPSGSGKGAANAVAREALKVGDLVVLNPGSGEGIIHAYAKRTKDGLEQHTQAVLFNVPEIDTLAAVGSRQGSTVMPILRSGWSGEQIGTQTADPTRRVHVADHAYRMCMVAGIQPGRASALLDDEDGGTPQRFLWLPATDPHMPEQAPAAPARVTVINHQPATRGPSGLVTIDVCKQARDIIIQARLDHVRGNTTALDGHALLTRLKTAAALALLDQRRGVNDDDWQLAGTVMAVSDATRGEVITQRQAAIARANAARAIGEAERQVIITETVAEKSVPRVARGVLRRLQMVEQMPWSQARTAVAKRDRPHFDEAVEHLVRGGQVVIDGAPEAGQKGAILRAI